MGQIDLFEPDNTDKVVSEILDDKALSEILEVPDDHALSEILEIPDFTDGASKADTVSDISELDCKVVETKDAVRSCTEGGLGHGAEVVESDLNSVAYNETDNRNCLKDGPLGCTGLVAPSSKVIENGTDFHAKKPMVAKTSDSTAHTSQADTQSDQAVINAHDKSKVIRMLNEAENDDGLGMKGDTSNIVSETSEMKSDHSGSPNNQSVGSGPGLASRCLSPKVDISIPSRVKSTYSLASRGIKKPNLIPVVSQINETSEKDSDKSGLKNQLVENQAQIRTPSENRKANTDADHRPIRETAYLGTYVDGCQSTGSSSKLDKPSLQSVGKDLKAKAAVELKEKDIFVANDITAKPSAPQDLKYHPESSSFASFKKGMPDLSLDKRSISRVYRNIPNKTKGPRHAVINTGAKRKCEQQGKNDDIFSGMKPTFV